MPYLKGWQEYPKDLDTTDGLAELTYNYALYRQQLDDDSARLFVPKGDPIGLKVIEFGARGNEIDGSFVFTVLHEFLIEDYAGLDGFLTSPDNQGTARLILIPQQFSWGHLVIDECSMRKLLTRFDVFPPFIDTMRAFGQRTGYEDESYSNVNFRSGHEITYLVKHVEKHGREEKEDPWSVRQMGVYHKHEEESGDVIIIVNPSYSFQRRIKKLKQPKKALSLDEIHLAILSCSMENWKWYISDLEKKYVHIKYKAQLTQIDETGDNELSMADVRFKDTQSIQYLQDKFHQLSHVFQTDRCMLLQVQNWLQMHENASAAPKGDLNAIAALLAVADIQSNRINSLLKRLDGTFALIETTLDFRCLASLQHNSRSMNDMAGLARHENQLIVQLSKKASRDTDILKTLTLLALIYLPASLASSMMGMEYIKVHTSRGRFSIQFENEFVIFVVLTVILFVVTVGPFVWYLHKHRTRIEPNNGEKSTWTGSLD
ncbi:MAG: hypothetical protein M1820_003586 [Bogoriella megaspora]|nr:MAG: hypothetical protein M1820_003586 [Bogoriella megaspora]